MVGLPSNLHLLRRYLLQCLRAISNRLNLLPRLRGLQNVSRLASADILEKSRSGYNLNAAERIAYLEMLEETRNEIERFETELHRLREVAKKLQEQKMFLHAYEAGIRHVISPIQRLPLEILGLIFQYVCCGKNATDIANDHNVCSYGITIRLPTIDMSSVCIKWYRTVSSMPILWTSFGHDGFGSGPISQSLVRNFLERSRLHLVDFRVSDYTTYPEISPSPLVTHCNRWRHVSIGGSVQFVCESFLQPLIECGNTPSSLISLDLTSYLSESPFKIHIAFPSLQSLNLCGFVLDFETPQYTVTTLYLSKVTSYDVLQVLLALPNVESLKLEDIEEYGIDYGSPIVLNKIETLTLTNHIAESFLAATNCPHLTCLCLGNTHASAFQSIISFLDRSHCVLTHLVLKFVSCNRAELLWLFKSVPSLTQLDVKEQFMLSHERNAMKWTLRLLVVGHQYLGSQEAKATSEISDDEDGSYSADEGSESEQDHNNLQELLLPQLAELNLDLRPRNKLLLDVVRSRRPVLENSLGDSTNRTCLQTLRIGCPDPHTIGPAISQQFEDLRKILEPFKEGGMNVEFCNR
ncbi:hypothetical protein EV361DRAFT_885038 [Lentinula raphanica]|nr:hypothetical protein EV361DRAFT_885038 [Lentinula raphanica]